MPRAASYSGSFDEMPVAVQRAAAVPRDYYSQALCRPGGTEVPALAWTADPNKTYMIGSNRMSGEKLNELAMTTCRICPVQWECAAVAIAADEAAGIWADTIDNLRRFRFAPEALVRAKARGIPVQIALTTRLRGIS